MNIRKSMLWVTPEANKCVSQTSIGLFTSHDNDVIPAFWPTSTQGHEVYSFTTTQSCNTSEHSLAFIFINCYIKIALVIMYMDKVIVFVA